MEWQENESEDWTSTEIPVRMHPDKVYLPAYTSTSEEITLEPMMEEKVSQKITYTVTGLNDGALYLFRVRAKNKQGAGEPLLMKGKISTKEFKGISYILI